MNWEAISPEFNPEISEESFQATNINRVYVDMFGFKDDVEVIYSDALAQGQGYLKIYSVFKKSGSFGTFKSQVNGQNLDLKRYGSYECSIQSENGNITNLEGLCFVRMQILLPVGAQIEVYNVKQLISKRFIPISAEEFIRNFKDSSFSDGKNAAIADYLGSYNGMSVSPQLTSAQLGMVVHEFSWKEEKLNSLTQLQTYVVDRENLKAMIDKEFSYFDREEAKRICGL